MPTYDYSCKACSKKFTKFQTMSSEPYADCPSCGEKTRRSISKGSGIIFKGSGFYTTDYKKKEKPETGKTAGSSNTQKDKDKKDTKKKDSKKESSAAES